MPTSYTSLLGLALPATGELSGTWGNEVNNFITQYVDAAVAGTQVINGNQTAVTLSVTNGGTLTQVTTGATGSAQYAVINCTGNPASTLTITVPSSSREYLVINATSTNQSVVVKGAATSGVTIAAGARAVIAWNGNDFVQITPELVNGAVPVAEGGTGATSAATARTNLGAAASGANSDITSITGLTTALSVAQGGTGATAAAGARTNLGATTVGGNLFTLTNPSAVTFPRFNADNTVSALDAATFRTAIGAGNGDVTLTGTQTLTNKTIEAGVFTNGYTEETVFANTGTAYTIDLLNGTVQILTLTGNCTFTFPTATAGRSFVLFLRQDATGSRTVTWPAAVKWPGGTAPTITATVGRLDKFIFTADNTNWYGSNGGQNYTV